jgi:hypothetical protein
MLPLARLANMARHPQAFLAAFAVGYTLLLQPATNVFRVTRADPTVFAYAGRLVRAGLVPYKDFWEAKSPGIFYAEALGYGLFGFNWWGPTLMQLCVYVATALCVVLLSSRMFSTTFARAAFVVFAMLLLNNPASAQGSNITETYQVLPTVLALVALWPNSRERSWKRSALAGVLVGIAFLFRPTAASLGVVATIVIAFRWLTAEDRRAAARESLVEWGAFVAGGTLVLSLVSGYFAMHGVAGEMWFATLHYNVTVYKDMKPPPPLTDPKRYFMLREIFGLSSQYMLFLLAGVSCLGAWHVRGRRYVARWLFLAAAWIACDIALALATGRMYGHYAYPLGLSAAFGAALLFEVLSMRLTRVPARLAMALALTLVAIQSRPLASKIASSFKQGIAAAQEACPNTDEFTGRLLKALVPGRERVLIWGCHLGPLAASARLPAHPLLCTFNFRSEYARERWAESYLNVLSSGSARVFVSTDFVLHDLIHKKKLGTQPIDTVRKQVVDLLHKNYRRLPTNLGDRDVFVVRGFKVPSSLPTLPPQCKVDNAQPRPRPKPRRT